ncbi:hypothetical protein BRAS3843_2910026 [Bradyrhizobium sp. STM 3843]|nr:hypothetical protein BRAS3843_2910026 [Bradyrhizobium sp. STM 3843]
MRTSEVTNFGKVMSAIQWDGSKICFSITVQARQPNFGTKRRQKKELPASFDSEVRLRDR